MKSKKLLTVAMFMVCLFGYATLALAGDRKPVPIPTAPKEMTFKSLRAVQYCEVWLFVREGRGRELLQY